MHIQTRGESHAVKPAWFELGVPAGPLGVPSVWVWAPQCHWLLIAGSSFLSFSTCSHTLLSRVTSHLASTCLLVIHCLLFSPMYFR